MKRLAVGILAHVDAGKTTLSESMLYESGTISKLGRVDNKDAFLDTNELERSRGITIFSKQAVIQYKDTEIFLLDTPGHVDFSAEMERTLWVMDYAILVVSGADGIQGHTRTLWKLLERYQIPVFVFINKMDQVGVQRDKLLQELHKQFGEECIDFDLQGTQLDEQIAMCDELVLEHYLENGQVQPDMICELISDRKIFPCFFGSALKLEGVKNFLDGLLCYTKVAERAEQFGAKIFKISRDQQGNRLTYLLVTGGELKVKDSVTTVHESGQFVEKINQIRIYSGEKYVGVQTVPSGTVCAVTGLMQTYPGQGIGMEQDCGLPMLEPVLTYSVELPEEIEAIQMLPLLRQLEEEQPEMHVMWQEDSKSIQLKLMGEVQIDVLSKRILDDFGVIVKFGTGDIVYKETIANVVEGVGHFEPLRHYAEVHLLLEPGEMGSGIMLSSQCSEDILDKNWQRLILTHLEEKEHVGVLTGSAITDVQITLMIGKAHIKHTEGGDFRQATYRAVRHALMQAESVLLEPYYQFRIVVPQDVVGKVMTDMNQRHAVFEGPQIEEDMAVIEGCAPVATIRDYQIVLNTYTKGRGTIFCTLKGYGPCHNAEEVIEQRRYEPEQDLENPSSSVFCSHGAGFVVPWWQVKDYMHLESVIQENISGNPEELDDAVISEIAQRKASLVDGSIDDEQIELILNQASHANEKVKKHSYKKTKPRIDFQYKGQAKPRLKEHYLIVDGYNIIHAWDELKCLVHDNLEGARMKLMDMLSNYQGYVKHEIIVVFDAYLVKGNLGEMFDYQNIHVVYTKEAETADSYIEKLTHRISKDYHVTVATSDGLIQLITRGQNCIVMSANELRLEFERVNQEIREYIKET